MKLQLDTEQKTIKIDQNVKLSELFEILEKMLPNGLWKEYTLEVGVQIVWAEEKFVPINPALPNLPPIPYPNQPWNPINPNPIFPLPGTTPNPYYPFPWITCGSDIAEYKVVSGKFNVEG